MPSFGLFGGISIQICNFFNEYVFSRVSSHVVVILTIYPVPGVVWLPSTGHVRPDMPARLPSWRLNIIQHQLFDLQLPYALIEKDSKVSRSTLYRLRLSWALFGQPYPPRVAKEGRPRTLTPAQEQVSLLQAYFCCGLPLICSSGHLRLSD
jgi:hypothetical protein